MTVYSEVIDFTAFNDNLKLQDLLNSFKNSLEIHDQMFQLCCIKNAINSAIYIYESSVQHKLPLNIIEGIRLSLKNSNKFNNWNFKNYNPEADIDLELMRFISYFISKNSNLREKNDQLLFLAIEQRNSSIVSLLVEYCQYHEPAIIKIIYDYAMESYSHNVLMSLINKGMVTPSIEDMNNALKNMTEPHSYCISDSNFIYFVRYTLQNGANSKLLENTLFIPQLIFNKYFDFALEFLSYEGNFLNFNQQTINLINHIYIDNPDVLYPTNTENTYLEFKSYAKTHKFEHNYTIACLEYK